MSDLQTLDQQIGAHGPALDPSKTGENALVPTMLGLEPMGAGVRVTARDEQGRTLWGFVASQPVLGTGECVVGVYDRLLELLKGYGIGPTAKGVEPAESISRAIAALEDLAKTVDNLKAGLDVRKPSEATARRAEVVTRLVRDAALTLRQGSGR